MSNMGGTGNSAYDAFSSDAVFNGTQREYLVAWSGEDSVNGIVNGDESGGTGGWSSITP